MPFCLPVCANERNLYDTVSATVHHSKLDGSGTAIAHYAALQRKRAVTTETMTLRKKGLKFEGSQPNCVIYRI